MSKWGGEASYNELVAILAQLKAGIPIADLVTVVVSGGTALLVSGTPIDPRSIRALTSSDVVTVQDYLSSLTAMPTTKQAKEVDFTWNVDGTVNSIIYKDMSGITAFTLTFAYSAGSVISITRT